MAGLMKEMQIEQIACSQGQLSLQRENQFEHVWNAQRGELSGLSGNP
jgi:hypothetical protein